MSERVDAGSMVDGRYRVIGRLGSGGMAEVYCAEDLQLGRKVALKLLYPRFAEDQEFVERFRREASSAAGLQHPNIVAVYDRGELEDTSYIAMEFVEGRTLKQLILDEAPLDARRAVGLTLQVLRAARFAHKRGVIHRDLKPQNVIVDEEGRAKVTDFGIAKAGASDMTQTGSIMGTAQYLSPEQAQGLPVSAASDLYSIGIMLYEMLCARVPFEGDSAVAVAVKQVNEAPVPPSRLNPAVGHELEAVVLRALEKDPARRFADADEFMGALERARDATPGGADATGSTAIASGVAAGAAGALAGGVLAEGPYTAEGAPPTGVYPAEPYYGPPGPLPPLGPEDERQRRGWWIALIVGLVIAALVVGGLLLFGGQKVTVPSVLGAPSADAQTALRNAGLSTEIVDRTSDRPKDTVIAQDPEGGSRVDKDSTVTLTVSSGPGEAQVPDVTDKGRRAALRALQKAGFDVTTREETSTDVGKDHVISTSPPAGSTLEKGQQVVMVVSTGPQKVDVPNVVGQTEDDARAALEGAGFKVTTTEKEDADHDPGTVLQQDPAGGGQAGQGATVRLTLAKAPDKADVPDVVGQTQDQAITTLSAAGFTVVPKSKAVTDKGQDGKVVSQSPSSGGQAKKGSKVTITVGAFTAPPTPTTPTTPTTPDNTGGAPTDTTP